MSYGSWVGSGVDVVDCPVSIECSNEVEVAAAGPVALGGSPVLAVVECGFAGEVDATRDGRGYEVFWTCPQCGHADSQERDFDEPEYEEPWNWEP